MEVLLVTLIVISTTCYARQRTILLEKVQSSGTLHGLACAISNPLNSIGGEFDTQTGTCKKLPRAWLSNSTLEPNKDYFKLLQLENIVPESSLNDTIIPPIFVPGGTMMLYIQTTATPLSGIAMLDFVDLEFSRSVYNLYGDVLLHNKLQGTTYALNSFLNNYWGAEEHATNPFLQSNTTYLLEFHFTDSKVEISVDGQLLHSYNHRAAVSLYQRLWVYKADNLVCKRILFKY